MRTTFLFYFGIVFLQFSCIFSNYKEKHEQEILRQIDSLALIQNQKDSNFYQLDYSNMLISIDSLDIKLFELIENNVDMNEDLMLKNIDILIQQGAKPDALVEYTYSVRKPGSYIPIIKEFYANKYRDYTTTSTALHAAAGCGKLSIMKKLVSAAANVNIANADKLYPIDIAIKSDYLPMVNFLIEAKADLKKANLAMSENIDLIEQLVKSGANPKTININFALRNKAVLKRLLVLKPDLVNCTLDFTILMNDNDLFDLLISNGLSPNVSGTFPDACPAIIGAIKYDNFRIFTKLHSLGADLNVVCRAGFGETPMQTAIYYQRIEVLKYLIDNKVSPNEKDWTKKSALYKACSTDNDQIINLLIDAGAEIDYFGYFDKTPLMESANSGFFISAQALINRKANVNFKNKYGETPLVLAIKHSDLPMIKLLIENGAKADITYESKTMVEYAQQNSAPQMIIDYLKKMEHE